MPTSSLATFVDLPSVSCGENPRVGDPCGGDRDADAPACRAAAAWPANLELRFASRANRTTLVHRRHRGPLQVQKALYPEGPAVCHIALLHPPGGIAGCDRLNIRGAAQEKSHAVLTTPGATKWYRSAGAEA